MVRLGGAEYVRSIQKANPDGSLSFYCAIDEGLVLTLSEGRDLLQPDSRACSRTSGPQARQRRTP